MVRFCFFLNLFIVGTVVNGQTVLDVEQMYSTVNASTIQQAVNQAVNERATHPDTDVVVSLPQGVFYLNKEISVDGLNSQGVGWLIIQGQGQDLTTLVDDEYDSDTDVTFAFNKPIRLKIADLSIEGKRLTTSQGTIVKINAQLIDIDLDENYPTPDEMFEIESDKANKIRIIQDTPLNSPHYMEGDDNDHYSNRWSFQGDYDHRDDPQIRPVQVNNRVWRFKLGSSDKHPFEVGQRVGISSKSNRSNWAVFKSGGKDIVVENVTLKRLGRCKFRYGWENIRFTNVKIVRTIVNGKPSFYSTDAGPQFGHDSDNQNVVNLIVENCDFRGTVDDGTAFQRVVSGIARNNYWEDGGGVLVGTNCSSDFLLKNNTFYHNPLEDNRPGAIQYKGAYQPEVIYDKNSQPVKLKWKSGSRSDIHDIYFGSEFPLSIVTSQVENEFVLPTTLLPDTNYYWQVFERNESENLGVNKSDIWSFTTPLISSLKQDVLDTDLLIHPNPTSDVFNIKGVKDCSSVSIYTIQGMLIEVPKNAKSSDECQFDLSAFEAGIYLIGVESKVFKIIKK